MLYFFCKLELFIIISSVLAQHKKTREQLKIKDIGTINEIVVV